MVFIGLPSTMANSVHSMSEAYYQKTSYWDTDDISAAEEDIYSYRAWILSQKDVGTTLVKELERACKYDYINRCSVVCDIIQEKGEPNILGPPFVKKDGTTMLHVACLSNSTVTGCHLVSIGGKDLVVKTVNKGHYRGSTALHLACLQGNTSVVQAMLDSLTAEQCHMTLRMKASGDFFTKHLKISGLPLTIAIWAGHKELSKLLMKYGAQLDMRDTNTGQTVLHAIITKATLHPEKGLHILKWVLSEEGGFTWWCLRNNQSNANQSINQFISFQTYMLQIADGRGKTPLLYAGEQGVPEIINFILGIEGVYRFTVWKTKDVSSIEYNVQEIDPIVNKNQPASLLEYLAHMSNPKALEVLKNEPLRSLVSNKWDRYKHFFIFFMIFHIGLMILYTVTVIQVARNTFFPSAGRARMMALGILGVAAIYALSEIIDVLASAFHWYKYPQLHWKVILKPDIFRVFGWIFSWGTFAVVVLHVNNHSGRDSALAISATSGWYLALGFTRMFRTTGFFTSIVHRIFSHDIMRFAIVIIALLVGFSTGSLLLFQQAVQQLKISYAQIVLNMFTMMLGLTDFDATQFSQPTLFLTLYMVTFILISTLTMLNMLIASMMDTYSKIINKKEIIWRRNRLLFILIAERRLAKPILRYVRSRYLNYCTENNLWLFSVLQVKQLTQDDQEWIQ